MRRNTGERLLILMFVILVSTFASAQTQQVNLSWTPRDDLNILLPASVRIYETNGFLADSARIRAMCAIVDLRDENLKLRAIGSHTRRETTLDTYERHNSILAINGGYFASNKSVSLIVSDGELVAPGPADFTRGAFGLVNRKPEIVWPYTIDSSSVILRFADPAKITKDQKLPSIKKTLQWHPSQAVGGGPVLIKEGRIRDTSQEEGFGGSHLLRHPRTAIGYRDDYTLVMIVVDGRQRSSAGVTIKELAQIMLETGCYEAVNLDGGGSSAMIAADEVVNVPVDIPDGNRHSLRRNASALVLTEEMPLLKKEIVLIDTDNPQYEERGIWRNTNHANYYGDTPSREALGNNLNKAVYRFVNIRPDSFQLAAWWTVNERNTRRATFILHHGQKIDSIHVDQTSYASNGKWNVFGNYLITPGDYLEVISQSNEKFVTDAIRLVSIGHLKEQPPRGDLRVAVISDLNSGLGSATYEWQVDSIIRRIPRSWRPDLVLCGGDMVAGMGVSDPATLTSMWKGFNEHIAEPLRNSKIPFAFTIGNHDGLRSYPLERDAIARYWADPAHDTGLDFVDSARFPHYYSFRAGDSFFVSWDASSSEITKENLSWMAKEFERPEAKNARFRFVVGHLPLYSVAQERDSKGNVLENAETLRKLLEQHNVNVYISGHQHAYYPGKRGTLQLLNCGAAGSGPRRWLSTDKHPIHTITIMDVFYEKDTIIYTTYDIKHREAIDMPVFDHHALPSSISGVNGFLIRHDMPVAKKAVGVFYPLVEGMPLSKAYGTVDATIRGNMMTVTGRFDLDNKLLKSNDAITFCVGKQTESGAKVLTLRAKTKNQRSGTFSGSFEISEGMTETLSVGGFHILIRSDRYPDGDLRAQLYPESNASPQRPVITSHDNKNIYGIRNSKGLYQFSWTPSQDNDGDHVSYAYQIATDSLFNDILLQEYTGRVNVLKKSEAEWYALLNKTDEGKPARWYHRVVASDGLHVVKGDPSAIHLIKSDEPLTDFIELDPEQYVFDGRIENASGQGSGALWDKAGKLWLADYGGALHIKLENGTDATFSPLRTVTVNNRSYSLRPVNGIGLDLDGHILVGSNRLLIKIDANTGEGIAVWEVPEGKRAITSPRVTNKGEIYAMSLFAEDPNYVLKQSTESPGTFELVRTIRLPQRILTRTFDMTVDGLTLFFPDPGSAVIQTFTSTNGSSYRRGEDITSTAAGCNAVTVNGGKLFAAVRASGISGSTLHMRDENKKIMWTLPLPELDGAEARGIAVSRDLETVIICTWDKGGGFYRYRIRK